MNRLIRCSVRQLLLLVAALGLVRSVAVAAPYDWHLPPGFPPPRIPAANEMTAEKVELGRRLFYDRRLSGNQTTSCGSCHLQRRAFADGRDVAIGSTGEVHPRNSMGLANTAYASTLTWANPLLLRLEQQILIPLFGEEPVELGMAGRETELLARLEADEVYASAFAAAYPESAQPITVAHLVDALAAFVRSLISGNAPYDRFIHGIDSQAMSDSAIRGARLFFSERLECFHCHGGFNLSDAVTFTGKPIDESPFHNNGLYNIDGRGAYPYGNTGVHEITGRAGDMGRFKAPSLRNIELTAPYMHDGSIPTLEGVLEHYAAGGRTIHSGPYSGDGSRNPFKSELLVSFQLSDDERDDVLNFLKSLTDHDLVTNPRYHDPFREACPSDCDGDGLITPDELHRAITIALGSDDHSECAGVDADRDGTVAIEDLVDAAAAICR